MKKFIIGAVGAIALGLSAPASAADMAARPITKAPPPAIAAVYDWSGFYIGLNGGWARSERCWDFVNPLTGLLVAEGCNDADGGTVGGQLGYRWQSANWVFGFEGQGNWADISGDRISLLFPADRLHARVDAFGLITGQIGYAWNNVLLYVKGGAAVVGNRLEISDVATGLVLATRDETRWGATVGAGIEVGFSPNWSVGFEYNHIFLDDRDVNFTTPAGVFIGTNRVSQDVDMALIRVNYRWGGPVIAKY
ncbi:MAG: porin family protein [Bradyrhizobium sp.]|uniref:outer membrane protein n=1 Tax=Bradyrhizobium sp. TaxID=376 RepID=UPI0025BCF59C|nr:porin family protein [Bradyrhizobium sp.]MBI5264955.1 porin family protein [Bradyrhizobium sp.]